MNIKTEHKIHYFTTDQPLSIKWRVHDLVAVLVGFVRALRVTSESWLLISCLKMPSLGFPRWYVHQARRSMACKMGWQTARGLWCFAVFSLGNRLMFPLFCLIAVGELLSVPSWPCHVIMFMISPSWRRSSLIFKQKSASLVGNYAFLPLSWIVGYP